MRCVLTSEPLCLTTKIFTAYQSNMRPSTQQPEPSSIAWRCCATTKHANKSSVAMSLNTVTKAITLVVVVGVDENNVRLSLNIPCVISIQSGKRWKQQSNKVCEDASYVGSTFHSCSFRFFFDLSASVSVGGSDLASSAFAAANSGLLARLCHSLGSVVWS